MRTNSRISPFGPSVLGGVFEPKPTDRIMAFILISILFYFIAQALLISLEIEKFQFLIQRLLFFFIAFNYYLLSLINHNKSVCFQG